MPAPDKVRALLFVWDYKSIFSNLFCDILQAAAVKAQ